ncbi:hypothetical protein [Quadrisphaera setariae]|uniref:Uncharacterized protein n=1 Tax=Quadrisphaera setariae TaxID=2593304 RepID=A0A5C8Z7Q8_9ACTN|nr:hypothetical protein [Quadrisphaera setariae]TXR52886.1 hypothetical protein FMM08_17430 [Quadrisphaera setariae]
MPEESSVPRGLLDGVVVGLVLMAVFTTAWSANTLGTWPGALGTAITAVGVLASTWFVVTAVRLARTRGRASTATTPEEQRWQKRAGMAFGWVFTAEAVLIVVAANVLGGIGRPDLVLPAIALVVGVHFYPMARIFRRRIDTWLATALSAVGLAGLLVLLLTSASRDLVWGVVACGAALTTGAYGVYFTRMATALRTRARS